MLNLFLLFVMLAVLFLVLTYAVSLQFRVE
jgi:hypothetical protein